MSKDFYNILWVDKTATNDEIKKAYRKLAMKYHPDRNKQDKEAEKKFKEVNEAYSILSDTQKRKQYDTFWSSSWHPFSGWNYSNSWFSRFEDIFSWFWWFSWWQKTYSSSQANIDLEDLFWWFSWSSSRSYSYNKQSPKEEKKEENLNFEKTYEVPIFDLILWCKIEVRWVYGQTAKLRIPEWTKSWTKFRGKDFWKSEWTKKWNLIVKIEWIMPKNISDVDRQMLERIRENVWY